MPKYNQGVVRAKLNRYLEMENRSLSLNTGYCHGMALFWLEKISRGKVEWYYKTKISIVNYSLDQFQEIEVDVEKFLSHIEWGQRSRHYLFSAYQFNIEEIVEKPHQFFSFIFTRVQLQKALVKIIKYFNQLCISGPNHTIGFFKEGKNYYIYDSNDDSGRAKKLSTILAVIDEIINCLFEVNQWSGKKFPIQFILIGENKKQIKRFERVKDKMLNRLIASHPDINEKYSPRINNFYLACESGDVQAIKCFLKNGIDPNQQWLSWRPKSPLGFAAKYGHNSLLIELIRAGANFKVGDDAGNTPLHNAAEFAHTKTVNILVESGADPLQQNKAGKTPLAIALEKKEWLILAIMINFINDLQRFSQQEREQLEKASPHLLRAVNSSSPSFFSYKKKAGQASFSGRRFSSYNCK